MIGINNTTSALFTPKRFYQGQALAIVLIVLVVGVIIALAIISRTASDQQLARQERQSADSLEYADTVIDSVKNVTFDDFVTFADDPLNSDICNPSNFSEYSVLQYGCSIEGEGEFDVFSQYFASKGLDAYYNTLFTQLASQCDIPGSGSTPTVKLTLEAVTSATAVEVGKDDVFSFRTNGQVPNTDPASCQVQVEAGPLPSGSVAGIIASASYVLTSGGNITSFKPYEYSDIQGYCFNTTGCNLAGWSDWTNWSAALAGPNSNFTLPDIPTVKVHNGTSYYLNELRLRPVNADAALVVDLSTPSCVEVQKYMKVSAVVNCAGNSRGKQIVISSDDWAPSIFDYVLFNGDGTLEHQ